ncbi:MAG TPA: MATE family efflux transporter, partial [Defluviitaleaceae bacterium]|nr:MATE family efflux transporter [Defluviitaleaceae bacterium]
MEKSIFKNFSRYVSLNILGMVSISCYILTDTYFISKALGHQGLAALDLSTPMYSFIYAVALMLAIGGSTRYSILKAKKDTIRANRVYSICINVGLITGILFAMIGIFFSNSLGVLLGADIEILPMTEIYLRTILCFSPFFIL